MLRDDHKQVTATTLMAQATIMKTIMERLSSRIAIAKMNINNVGDADQDDEREFIELMQRRYDEFERIFNGLLMMAGEIYHEVGYDPEELYESFGIRPTKTSFFPNI